MFVHRPISLTAVAASVRYGTFSDEDVFFDVSGPNTIRWIRVAAVWRSKRRFHLRTTLDEFTEVLRSDNTRYQLWQHEDNSFWVRAI